MRLNELVKEELGKIILREIEFPIGIIVTITRVETSSDLNSARVYIGIFPEKFAQESLRTLNQQIYFVQQKLNKKLNMRPVPKLIFRQEKETIKAGRVEELLEQVRVKPVAKKKKR
ncbi:30S ribosome-binding factor RbfA [Patescibacteria group bacterium]|nr:30S ribosome-binding factor RbfA [Patescibacteria group bacterium]